MKYDINNILIGDEVIFNSTKKQHNFDEYWTVIGKEENQIMIELKRAEYNESYTLNIEDVVGHIPLAKR